MGHTLATFSFVSIFLFFYWKDFIVSYEISSAEVVIKPLSDKEEHACAKVNLQSFNLKMLEISKLLNNPAKYVAK